jgi:histone demethylase
VRNNTTATGTTTPPRSPRPARTTRRATREGEYEESPVKLEKLKLCEVRMGPLDSVTLHPAPRLSHEMTAHEIVSECERVGPGPGHISTSILPEGVPTPMPKRRSELPKVTPEQLLPPTPCVHVKTKQDAFSPQLLDWCLQRPITVIRGLAQACEIDLTLYTTKTLTLAHPHHPVEIRTQLEQSSEENWEPSMKEQVWYCTSSRSHTTISKYAEIQATSFKEAKDRLGENFSVNPPMELKTHPDTGLAERRTIKFGTNCDLSDERKWKLQIQEMMKLPSWLRVVSAGNMLSHIGHQILGMNTIQLYMKVPQSRTPGHQENNNFAAVNMNIGPGDSEWFGVPDQYWGPLQELCEKNSVDYLHGSWWPKMEDLKEMGIPCYRFMQRPGELVWINTGCVHWVQANGWCNNVAWNTGPLTTRQYKAAVDRYEWNKSQRYQSIVAMAYLTWNMARNIRVSDPELYIAMKTTLMRSIRQSVLMKQYALENDIPVRFHGHSPNEPVNYCMVCEEEVFNLFFVKENEKKHVVHCLRCARQLNKDLTGWICLEEYDIEDLCTVYDNFVLGNQKVEATPENPCKLSLVNDILKKDVVKLEPKEEPPSL